MTNNDLQNIAQKTKDRAILTALKTGCEFMSSLKGKHFLLHPSMVNVFLQ